jgi:hypothetical protein
MGRWRIEAERKSFSRKKAQKIAKKIKGGAKFMD